MSKWLPLIGFATSLLSHHIGFSQTGKISGTLTFEDGEPVVFATVYISSVNRHTLSNEKGWYEITNVPHGDHELEISSIEIEEEVYPIHVASSTTDGTLVLKRSKATKLSEVMVVGESERKIIETKGFAVNVVEMKSAAVQSVQTNDLLNRTVGIKVRQNGGLGSAVEYNLNGMSGNSVRIFIDGLPASTYGPSFSLNSIPPALIERIEIYKGVIPPHLADDALGGAINVILKSALNNILNASASYGSFNTFQGNFSGVFRNDKSGLTVKASGFHNYSDNDYKVWGKFVRNILANGRYDYVKARRFNDAYRSTGGQVALGFTNVKWADQVLINYNGSNDYNEIQHGTYMSIPYKGRFTESQAHVTGLIYKKSDLFTPGLDVSFNGVLSRRNEVVNDTVKWNYNWYGERSIGLNGDPILRPQGAQQGEPTINDINRKIGTYRAVITYAINSHHKIVLANSFYDIKRREEDELGSAVEREFVSTRDLQKNISSLGYELNLFDSHFKGNFFGKYYVQQIDRVNPILIEEDGQSVRSEDRVTSTKNTTGYGMALSIAITRHFSLLASAEKAVRMPSENEIFGSPSENIVENVHLKPEISNNVNIGFRAGTLKIKDHHFQGSVTGFLRDTKDKIVQRINPNINDAVQTNPFENLEKTKAIGFEAEVQYKYKKSLSVLFNFSRFNSVYNAKYDSNGNVYNNYNEQLPNEPFFTINSGVHYTFNDLIGKNSSLKINYNFGFVDRFYTTWLRIEDFRTPRQFPQDIGVNYTFPNNQFVLSADIQNIFNKQVYDNFAVQKPGRAFYLKLNYTLNNF